MELDLERDIVEEINANSYTFAYDLPYVLTTEELEMEIQKTEAVVKISDAILKNANLALRAQELFSEYGTGKSIPIPLLGITEGSIERNRKLKGDIQAHGKI